jgi:hypothetical protein
MWSVCAIVLCLYTHTYGILCYIVFLWSVTCVLLTCLLFPLVRIYLRTLRNIMFPFHLLLTLKICLRLQIKALTLTIRLHRLPRRDQQVQQIQTLYPKLRYVWSIVYNCTHVRCFSFRGIYKQGSHRHAATGGIPVWELDVGLSACPKKGRMFQNSARGIKTWTDPSSVLKQQKMAMWFVAGMQESSLNSTFLKLIEVWEVRRAAQCSLCTIRLQAEPQ